MIECRKGDIFESDAQAIVNPVNCCGVMGKGLALQFKQAFPDNFKAYQEACRRKQLQPGHMFVFERALFSPRFIINFPTKRHWRDCSRYEDIASGLQSLAREITRRSIQSIAIPPLGCGLGGLDWTKVKPMIENMLDEMPVRVILFEPFVSGSIQHHNHKNDGNR